MATREQILEAIAVSPSLQEMGLANSIGERWADVYFVDGSKAASGDGSCRIFHPPE